PISETSGTSSGTAATHTQVLQTRIRIHQGFAGAPLSVSSGMPRSLSETGGGMGTNARKRRRAPTKKIAIPNHRQNHSSAYGRLASANAKPSAPTIAENQIDPAEPFTRPGYRIALPAAQRSGTILDVDRD